MVMMLTNFNIMTTYFKANTNVEITLVREVLAQKEKKLMEKENMKT